MLNLKNILILMYIIYDFNKIYLNLFSYFNLFILLKMENDNDIDLGTLTLTESEYLDKS